MKYGILVLIVLALVCAVGSVEAADGCIVVQQQVITHGYSGPLSFTIDLKNSAGTVVNSLTFTGNGYKAFKNVPPGDYIITERDPGSLWKIVTANNVRVHVTSGQACSPANTVTIANEYNVGCVIVRKLILDHGYPGPMNFAVDLKNTAGNVVDTLTYTEDGLKAFLNVPPGDYMVAERDPGSAWKRGGDYNKPVRVVAGVPSNGCNQLTIVNEYMLGCIIVHKDVLGYSGPVSFVVDLKNSAGNVQDTLTYTGTGTQAFLNVPAGDFTVVERDPGSAWQQQGDYNTPVHVIAGASSKGCNSLSIANTYVPPVCINDLKATGSCDKTVSLSWTQTGADHYNVYRSTIFGGPYMKIGSVMTDSYDDSTAGIGTTYYYVVRTADTTDTELCQSNEVSAHPASCIPEFPTTVLPVTLIIGFMGVVIFIQSTREH